MNLYWVITFSVISFFVATDLFTPSMPSISKYFQVSEDFVQLTMVLFMLGAFVSNVFTGALAESFGRRRLFLGGQVISVMAALMCVVAPDPYTLVAGRFLHGLGASVALVIGFSSIQDLYTPKESTRIFAVMGTAFAVVPAMAPILGGYLDIWFGWRYAFGALFGLTVLSLLLSYFRFHLPAEIEQPKPVNWRESVQVYVFVLRSKKFYRYGMINALLVSGEWCALTVLPFYFIRVVGLSAAEYGYYLGAMLLCYGAGSYLSNKVIDLKGYDVTLMWALGIAFVAGVGIVATHFFAPENPEMIAVAIGIYLMGQGKSFAPSITKTLESFGSIRASASSVRSSMNAFFSVVGTAMAGLFSDLTLLPLALYLLSLPVLGLLIFKGLKNGKVEE